MELELEGCFSSVVLDGAALEELLELEAAGGVELEGLLLDPAPAEPDGLEALPDMLDEDEPPLA